MSLVLDGTLCVDVIKDGSVTPEDLAQKMTLMAAQTASGTVVDFTGIPSWAKRITVMFDGVSTNGTTNMRVQLGSGAVETTGYAGAWLQSVGTSTGTGAITAGFDIFSGGATSLRSGVMTIVSMGGNKWVAKGVFGDPDSREIMVGGSKTLSLTLDRVRITTSNGTDTFDAGSINVMYEG